MRVLVADSFEKSGIDGLTAAGCEVVYSPELADETLTQALRDTAADVLVVRSTAVTGAMLEAGSLSLIVRAGAGYNTIDVATASARGVYVSNCPGKNAIAVAELDRVGVQPLDPGRGRHPHDRPHLVVDPGRRDHPIPDRGRVGLEAR